MKSLLLISLFLLVSCGQKKYMPVKQDPSIMPFTKQFANAAQEYRVDDKIRKISFRFSNLGYNNGTGVIGQCVIYQKSYFNGIKNEVYEYGREIVIDATFFNSPQIPDADIVQLLTHELGHCSLDRNHQDGAFKDGLMKAKPVSVMNTYHIGDVFNTNTNYYLRELFNRNPTQSYLSEFKTTSGGSWASTMSSNSQNSNVTTQHDHLSEGEEHECEDGHVKIVMIGENDGIE